MFLNKIEIKNFKSLKDVLIEPSKITVLIGPNSSGKSSILQFLAILKQSIALRGNNQRGQFTTRGELIDLGEFQEVVTNHDLSKEIQFFIEGQSTVNYELEKTFGSGIAKFSYGCSISDQGITSIDFSLALGKTSAKFNAREPYHIPKHQNVEVIFPEGRSEVQARGYGGLIPTFNFNKYPASAQAKMEAFQKYFQNSDEFSKFFLDFHYILTSRVIDEYSFPYEDFWQDDIIGSKGHRQNISRLMSYLISNPNDTQIVSDWLKKLIGKGIRTKTVRAYQKKQEGPDITIEFVRGNVVNSIINEGAGPSQLVLLLAILAISKNNSIIGIEEPEINLHPKGQSELAKILLDIAITKNQQIIFTTHSEHILYPLLTSVASKKENSLRKEDLSIYYFDSDKNYHTFSEKLEVDDYGRIKGGLRGFFEENIESLNEYLDAVKEDQKEKK